MSGDERRAFERMDTRLAARVTLSSGAEIACRVENIGELGVYVSSGELEGVIEVGDRVRVSIERDDGTLEREGEVLRQDQEFTGGEIRRSFAIRFDEPITV